MAEIWPSRAEDHRDTRSINFLTKAWRNGQYFDYDFFATNNLNLNGSLSKYLMGQSLHEKEECAFLTILPLIYL